MSASGSYIIFGKPVARMGDKVSCPVPGHGIVTIVEGDPDWTDNDQPVVLEGHHCSCGCVLISTLPNVLRSHAAAAQSEADVAPKANAAMAEMVSEEDDDLEYYYVAKRDDGSAIDLAYRIESGVGKLHEGVLSSDGRTAALPLSQTGNAIFWISQS